MKGCIKQPYYDSWGGFYDECGGYTDYYGKHYTPEQVEWYFQQYYGTNNVQQAQNTRQFTQEQNTKQVIEVPSRTKEAVGKKVWDGMAEAVGYWPLLLLVLGAVLVVGRKYVRVWLGIEVNANKGKKNG